MKNRMLAALAAVLMLLGVGALVTPANASFIEQASTSTNPPKGHPPIPGAKSKSSCTPPVCYTYDGFNQFVGTAGQGAEGATIDTSQHKPYKDSADFHSLMEIAIQDDGSTAPQGNIVEIGWTMDAAVCGAVFTAGNPCLFTGSWVNDVFKGYNSANPNWVDNPAEPVNAGTALATTAGGASPTVFYTYGGKYTTGSIRCDGVTTDGTPVQTTSAPGWLMYRGTAGAPSIIGCFAASQWTSAGESFTKAHQVQVFDELASSDDHSCSDLGSGIFPPATYGTLSASHWVKNYSLVNPPAGITPLWGSAAVTPSFNTPTAFRLTQQSGGNDGRLGGPGWKNQGGTLTGAAGSCN